jgi:hypothetical protein
MMSRILPLLSIVIAIGLFFGYINPTRTGSIASTKAQIDSYESALDAAERFKQKESELIVARANIPSDGLARLESFLPDGVDNVQVILDLNALAARSGIRLSDFEATQNTTEGGVGNTAGTPIATGAAAPGLGGSDISLTGSEPVESLDITLSATGSYASFRAFLEGIEQSLRLLDVINVTVTDSETGVYTYEMTIRLYWLR